MAPGPRLTRRQLNRSLLRRQLLAEPSSLPVVDAVRLVAGLQAQVPKDPYVGLWSRLASFGHDDLAAAISRRSLVRVALMRSTIHLVTAPDVWALRPAVQPALDRELFKTATWSKPIVGLDLQAVLAEAREALRGQPMTATELGRRLQERWPDRDGRAMAYVVRNLEPLVQVPPRGLWGMPGQPRHATAQDWLGAPAERLGARDAAAAMITRYLAAFGPASVMDIQAWAGVTRLSEIIEPMRARLRVHAGEDGRELWDIPDVDLVGEDAPAPVRFLPEYDNAVLGYADRSRILPDGVTFTSYAARLRPRSVARGGVLVDGFLRGTWSVQVDPGRAAERGRHVLHLDPFDGEAFPGQVKEAGQELLLFAAAGAPSELPGPLPLITARSQGLNPVPNHERPGNQQHGWKSFIPLRSCSAVRA